MSGGSGDLLADRRYAYAEAALAEEDWPAAADLARQVIELAPDFPAAWFLLGTACEALARDDASTRAEAVAAYGRARRLDPDDALGAAIRLALLGEGAPPAGLPEAYLRRLFDDYAIRFDRHLRRGLAYRGPEILRDALRRACGLRPRPFRFDVALDLGCGTGLAAESMREACATLAGVDLSPAMVRRAEAKRLYDTVETGEALAWLDRRPAAGADLVMAVDVFVYLGDLAPIFASAARALRPGGLLGFTVQAHDGDGMVLGPDHRFAHSGPHLRALAAAAGLAAVLIEPASTRQERGRDVPGLVAVLVR